MANTIDNLTAASSATLRIAHQLRLMRDRRADNRARLRILELRLAGTAEADTRANAELPITFGRHASTTLAEFGLAGLWVGIRSAGMVCRAAWSDGQ